GGGGDAGAQPQTRAVRKHVPELNGEALAALDRLLQQISQVGGILRYGEILDPHLQQLRRRTPNDLTEPIVDQAKASGHVDLGDAHDRLTEHGAQNLLLLAQLAFEASSRRHISAHRKAGDRNADRERDEQQERFDESGGQEGTTAGQHAPGGEPRKNERRRRSVSWSASQRRP